MGTQMEAVVLGWFILTLTDSSFLVGLIWTARMSLNILALFAGAIADRLPRHRLLATVEFILASLGLLMLTLILSDRLEVWQIFVIAMLAGSVRVFQMPSAQSLVADTLPPDRIGNGAAFNHVGMNIGMLVGPLVGGILFKAYGPEGAFAAIATLYFLSGWSALLIRGARRTTSHERETVLRSVIEGLRYVKGEQVLWATLLLAVIIESSGWTFHTTLLPVFARDVLGTDAAGLGLLMFAFGIGALTGSIGLAMFRDLRHVGKLMVGAVVIWHSSILLFGTSHSFYLSFAVLIIIGGAWASTQVFMLSALLGNTQSEYRGRVIGLRSLAIYAFALGSMTSGAMAGLWGAPRAASVVGIMGIILVTALALFTPKLRRL
jgi:predicted MFS family arabinose efflux permease